MEDVRLIDLPVFANDLCRDIMRSHEKRFAERIKIMKRTSDDLSIVAGKLEVSIRNAWGSLDKTSSEQGVRLVQTIKEAAQQISEQDVPSEYTDLEALHKTAVEISNRIIMAIKKYVPKLYKVMKTEIASLNSSITRFEASINALGTALDESPGSEIESLKVDIRTLLQKDCTLNELHAKKREIADLIASSLEVEKKLLQDQEALLSQETFRELLQLNEALRSKGEAMEQFLQPLSKALKKYERTLSTDDKSLSYQILTRLIANPQVTVSETDPQTLLQIFNALNGALVRGELGIEEKKRKRAEEVIVAISRGELAQQRAEFISLQNRIRSTSDQLRATGLLSKKEELVQAIASAQSKIAQLNAQLGENEKRLEDTDRLITREKSQIEKEILKLSGNPIAIRT